MQFPRSGENGAVARRIEGDQNFIHLVQEFDGASNHLIQQSSKLVDLGDSARLGENPGAVVGFAHQFWMGASDRIGARGSESRHDGAPLRTRQLFVRDGWHTTARVRL